MSAGTITFKEGTPRERGENEFAGPDGTYAMMLVRVSEPYEDVSQFSRTGKGTYRRWTFAVDQRRRLPQRSSVVRCPGDRLEHVRERRKLRTQILAGLRQVLDQHGHQPRVQHIRIDVAYDMAESVIPVQRGEEVRREDGGAHPGHLGRHLTKQVLVPVRTARQRAVDTLGDQGEDALQPGVETVEVQRRGIDVQVFGIARG